MRKNRLSLLIMFRIINRPTKFRTLLFAAVILFNLFHPFRLHAQQWQYGTGTAYINGVNVGIGTSAPETNLHVAGNVGATYNSSFTLLSGANAIVWKTGTEYGFRLGTATNMSAAGWSEKMRITDAGYVGIGTQSPASVLDIVTGNGDGTTNEANCLRLRNNGSLSNSQLLQMGVSSAAAGGNNIGYGYISSVYWGGNENSPLLLNPKGGPVGFGLTSGVSWNATVKDAVAIRASGPGTNGALMGKLVFAHFGPYTGNSSFIAGVYDKPAFSSGTGLVFHTISGPDISGLDGVERMRISSDGNVGIGVTNPLAPLHLAGGRQPLSGSSVIFDKGTSDNQFYLSFYGNSLSQAFIGQPANVSNRLDLGTSNLNIVMSLLEKNVGIGTTTPQAAFHVNAGAQYQNGPSVIFDKGTSDKQFYLYFNGDNTVQGYVGQPANVAHRLDLGTDGNSTAMTILGTNIGIGTTTPQEKLSVNGTVCATKVRVAQTGCWADYVFNTGYRLRPLSEVEQYINQNHHLPEVPSAQEVEKNGLDVGDNQATLLKKVEELTLYMIEQNKKLESQQQQIDDLKKELKNKK